LLLYIVTNLIGLQDLYDTSPHMQIWLPTSHPLCIMAILHQGHSLWMTSFCKIINNTPQLNGLAILTSLMYTIIVSNKFCSEITSETCTMIQLFYKLKIIHKYIIIHLAVILFLKTYIRGLFWKFWEFYHISYIFCF